MSAADDPRSCGQHSRCTICVHGCCRVFIKRGKILIARRQIHRYVGHAPFCFTRAIVNRNTRYWPDAGQAEPRYEMHCRPRTQNAIRLPAPTLRSGRIINDSETNELQAGQYPYTGKTMRFKSFFDVVRPVAVFSRRKSSRYLLSMDLTCLHVVYTWTNNNYIHLSVHKLEKLIVPSLPLCVRQRI